MGQLIVRDLGDITQFAFGKHSNLDSEKSHIKSINWSTAEAMLWKSFCL